MTPYLILSHEQRALAARYLRTLAAVERAHVLGDTDDFEYVLGGVDPIDLKQLIAVIESAGAGPQSRTTREVVAASPVAARDSAEQDSHRARPSAPAVPCS